MKNLYLRVEYRDDDDRAADRIVDRVLEAIAEEDATLYVESRTDEEPFDEEPSDESLVP